MEGSKLGCDEFCFVLLAGGGRISLSELIVQIKCICQFLDACCSSSCTCARTKLVCTCARKGYIKYRDIIFFGFEFFVKAKAAFQRLLENFVR